MSFARLIALALLIVLGIGASAASQPEETGGACAALASDMPGATITAQYTPVGPSSTPDGPNALPPHCRVVGTLHPVPGSRIGFVLLLPRPADWTGRLQMFGNGGYSSQLPMTQLAQALGRGSAAVATDTGHQGDDPDFAIDHPEAIVDWASRAVHASVSEAKRLVARFYARSAAHSYFNGCSTGGHQAMMEAQRFPADFDGIVAGAPGSDRVRLNAGFLWQFLANHRPADNDHPLLSRDDLTLLGRASFAACRASNGASAGGSADDAWLDDPRTCRFDPAALLCRPGQHEACLSPDQVEAARRMYRGALAPRTGRPATTPWLYGSEPGWSAYLADPQHPAQPARVNFWRVWAFNDPQWDWWRFDFGGGLDHVRSTLGAVVDATSPNLAGFRVRGGKLLQYHGLADPVVSPLTTIAYHDAVRHRFGDTSRWYRLFLVPSMGHCGGGPGFTLFDSEAAVELWVEHGRAPDRIVAHRAGDPAATRPLCPYPSRAVLRGGSPTIDASFACEPQTLPGGSLHAINDNRG